MLCGRLLTGSRPSETKRLREFREGLDTRTELFQGRRFDIEVEDGVADAGSFEFRFVNRIVKFFRIAETHHADDDGVGIVFLGHVDEHLSTRFVRVQCQGAAVEVLPLLGKLFQRIDTGRYIRAELTGFLSRSSATTAMLSSLKISRNSSGSAMMPERTTFLPFHGCTGSFLTASFDEPGPCVQLCP